MEVDWFLPETRYLIVVHGARTMSSWSLPIMLAPLRLSTPTTLKRDVAQAQLLADRVFVAEQLVAMVWPMTQTLLLLRTSWSVKHVAFGHAASRARRGRRRWCR